MSVKAHQGFFGLLPRKQLSHEFSCPKAPQDFLAMQYHHILSAEILFSDSTLLWILFLMHVFPCKARQIIITFKFLFKNIKELIRPEEERDVKMDLKEHNK